MTTKTQYFGISRSTSLMAIVLVPITYILSYQLLSYYIGGDQIWYTNFYNALKRADFEDVMFLSKSHVGGAEPISAYILWFGANMNIEKNIFVSLFNVILIVSLFLLARKNLVKMPMIGLLLTNYYVIGLMVAAERLKFAYIILVIAMLFEGKIRGFLLVCTPFAHLQSILLLTCVLFGRFEADIKNIIFNFRFSKKSIVVLIGFSVASAIIVYYLFEGIKNKAPSYVGGGSISDLTNFLILMLIAIFVSYNRFRMTLVLSPFIFIIMAIGANRANMIAITIVIYYLMAERRLHHPLIYLLMFYFFVKTILFVNKIILYGQGYSS